MVAADVELSGVRSAFANLAPRLAGEGSVGRAESLEPRLVRRYPALSAWPADAQLALLCMALVAGPGFHLAGFREALSTPLPDFQAAARLTQLKGPSVEMVNEIAPIMLSNAAVVVDFDMSYSRVYFPADLAADLNLV